ncbi:MAG: ABC transporter permease [Treponema sp.]|jgi:phospholipid/cholesterol/gamma-HCH transport system permease protein|nr:ABC transporter permease [Treponema sp.]
MPGLYPFGFFIRLIKGCHYFVIRGQVSRKILVMQILFTFVEALGLSSLLALGIGTVVNVVAMPLLAGFSQEKLIYPVLIALVTREFGPLFVAFIISARSATAIATEVAGIVISHEAEAYISVGIDPIEHLGVPRFLGVTISVFLLNIYFSIFGLGASYLAAQLFNPMPAAVYFGNLLDSLKGWDIGISLIKSVVFGMIISTVAIYQGFSVERASTEVPVAGLKAVGSSMGLFIVADIVLSVLYYMVLA